MRRAHKLLSLLLVLTLALSLCAPVGAAYSDTSGHWAESAIDRWSAYGIVSGDESGFHPDGNLTRGQMAKILAEALGLTKQAENNPFADVADGAWYTPYILRCYEAGIMMGDGANANPNAPITREQAIVMLCRALGIAPAGGEALASFSDGGSVSSWAAPYVAAMVQSGIVNGVGNNSIAPAANISRAALMTILDRSVVQYINEPGSYELTDKAGIVLVAAGDVTLTGETRADVLVSPAAEGKGVAFDGATVTGSVTVQAEDVKVTSENSTLPEVSFTGESGGEVETVTPAEPAKPTTSGGSSSGGGSTPSHTHSWDEGVETTPATCTTAGVKTFTCSCGETKTEEIAKLAHTEVVDAAVAPTCTETGLTEGSHCSVCNTVITEQETVPATGHTPADTYTNDETGHWYVCTECGAVLDKEAHDYGDVVNCTEAATCDCGYAKAAGTHIWGEGVVTTPATCEEAGEMTYTCTSASCDTDNETDGNQPATKTEAIPAKGHTEVVDAAVEATCTEAGKTEGKHCSVCNEVLVEQTVVPAKGHTEVVDAAVEATCTEAGKTEGKHCSVCETVLVEQETVPATGHTEVIDAAVAPTCTEDGKTEGKHCSVCDTVLVEQTTVAATGHAYGDWTKADDTNHKRVCANDAEHVETAAHTWEETTCTACGATKTETAEKDVWFEVSEDGQELYLNWKAEEGEKYEISNSLNEIVYYEGDEGEAHALSLIHSGTSNFFTKDETVTFVVKKAGSEETLYSIDAEIKLSGKTPSCTLAGNSYGFYDIVAPQGEAADVYSYAVFAPDSQSPAMMGAPDSTISFSLAEGYSVQLQGYKIEVANGGKSLTVTVAAASDKITLDSSNFTACEAPADARTVSDWLDLWRELLKGGEVILGGDITLGGDINLTSGAPATLNLNGHTLTGQINVSHAKELKIDGTGEGSKLAAEDENSRVIEAGLYSKVTITDGTYDGFVYVGGNATVSITNATFTTRGTIAADSGATISITEGTFKGYVYAKSATISIAGGIFGMISAVDEDATISITGGTFGVDPAAYVDTATHTVISNEDGTYVVKEIEEAT